MTRLVTATAFLLLAGCAHTMMWSLPQNGSKSENDFHSDNVTCMQTARVTVGDQFVMGTPLMIAIAQASHDESTRNVFKECMMGKGYHFDGMK